MTSTTSYQKKQDLGEIAALLFGRVTAPPVELTQIHDFFLDKAAQYLIGEEHTCMYREALAVEPSPRYNNGAIYDLYTSSPGVCMEMTIRITQSKPESTDGNTYHYRIHIVLKGQAVSEEMKPSIEAQVKELDAMLFGGEQAKREEFFRKYAHSPSSL